MKRISVLTSCGLLLLCGLNAQAQGLIGTLSGEELEKERKVARRLELERARMFGHLNDEKSRREYGAILWELGETYELLMRWQDAIAAYNSLKDLKLPKDAISGCKTCVRQANDAVLAIDTKRLASKISAVESIDHKKFDHEKRLAKPVWSDIEKSEYKRIARSEPLPHSEIMPLKEILGN